MFNDDLYNSSAYNRLNRMKILKCVDRTVVVGRIACVFSFGKNVVFAKTKKHYNKMTIVCMNSRCRLHRG